MDGEPWSQKRSEMEILYRGQMPMLMQPVSEQQKVIGVMTDCLEWARSTGVIDDHQYHLLFNQYQLRMKELKNDCKNS